MVKQKKIEMVTRLLEVDDDFLEFVLAVMDMDPNDQLELMEKVLKGD